MPQCRILPFVAESSRADVGFSGHDKSELLELGEDLSDACRVVDDARERLGLSRDEFVWMMTEFMKARNL